MNDTRTTLGDKRLSEMTDAEKDDARVEWLRNNVHYTNEPDHIAFLLRRLTSLSMSTRSGATFCPHCNPCRHQGAAQDAMLRLSSWLGQGPGGGEFTSVEDMEARIRAGVETLKNSELDELRAHYAAEIAEGDRLSEGWNSMVEFLWGIQRHGVPSDVNDRIAEVLRKLPSIMEKAKPRVRTENVTVRASDAAAKVLEFYSDPRRSHSDEGRALLAALRDQLHGVRTVSDSTRLDSLEAMLRACPHAVITFNDDPDREDGDGAVPLGFSVRIDGCEPLAVAAPTLREALDAANAPDPENAIRDSQP